MLKANPQPLRDSYDLAVLDLDGVVYRGSSAVPHAPEALAAAAAAGMRIAFVTNNASRPPQKVAAHLQGLGIAAEAGDVVTSAQAAAHLASAELPPGSRVFLIGGPGLEEALRERGLVPVTESDDDVVAVAQGYGPDMPWRQVMAGAVLVRNGLPWFVTNTDMTVPTAGGIAPGNGALVRLVAEYAGRTPKAAGKPEPALMNETLERVGGEHPLVVGDRLDTDIEAANRVGWDSLLVLTGVTGLPELASAPPELRPSYIGVDLRALESPSPDVERLEGESEFGVGSWTAGVREGRLVVERHDGPNHPETPDPGESEPSLADAWRAAACASWAHLDSTGAPARTDDVELPGRRSARASDQAAVAG